MTTAAATCMIVMEVSFVVLLCNRKHVSSTGLTSHTLQGCGLREYAEGWKSQDLDLYKLNLI